MSKETKHSEKSPGEMLREARKSLGLSLADVAAMTRIPKAMLKHLESDRFDEYSAEVFARGHIRNYAREVKLDPEIVLQAFDRYTGRTQPAPESDEELEDEDSEPSGSIDDLGAEVWLDLDIEEIREQIQPAHLVAVGLVLFALFVVFGVLTGQRATAQKTNEFPKNSGAAGEDWQPDDSSEKSRWLLEKSDQERRETPSE